MKDLVKDSSILCTYIINATLSRHIDDYDNRRYCDNRGDDNIRAKYNSQCMDYH